MITTTISCIDPPAWAQERRIDRDEVSDIVYEAIQSARDSLLTTVRSELNAYFSDPSLVFESDDEFPSHRLLTGDYYWGDESYHVEPQSGAIFVSVMANFLAHPLPSQSAPDDYLRLQVWLEWHGDSGTFSIWRNTDSSAI